jgi:hypothetical protein
MELQFAIISASGMFFSRVDGWIESYCFADVFGTMSSAQAVMDELQLSGQIDLVAVYL